MPESFTDPSDEIVLVYTSCCAGQTPAQEAKLVFTKCANCKCPPGPAALMRTKTTPRGPGTALKFELDMP